MPAVTFLPDQKVVQVRRGTTLLQAAQKAKVPIRTRCGGYAGCLMCKVIVSDQEGLSPHTSKESRKLGNLCDKDYRLACQSLVQHDTVVQIPEDPLKAAVRAQLERQNSEM